MSAASRFIRFLLPSLAGMFLFLAPMQFEGSVTIPMGILNELLADLLAPYLSCIAIIILAVTAVLSPVFSLGTPLLSNRYPELVRLFDVSHIWLILRGIALVLAVLIVNQAGPEIIWGASTGKVVFYDLTLVIIPLFVVAVLLLPLLTDYGLMELVGSVLSPLFRGLFTLPGRAAVDASASWLSAAAVGILITSQQYQRGYYSAREACVIATNFSIVSLSFCLLIASVLKIENWLFEYYLTVVFVGIVTAMVLPRIPPLSRVPNSFFTESDVNRQSEAGSVPFLAQAKLGISLAVERANNAPGLRLYLKHALINVLDIWFGLIPGVIVVGLFGLVIAEYTPIVTIISYPLVPLLELMRLPEASAAAPTFLVGFADMFLPAALGKEIDSEFTRFVIAGVSVSQLVYMSEVGILILKSPIPLSLTNMVIIFFQRTAIALPLFVIVGHFLWPESI